eukprot:COSAG01_NODE_984_length_12344_cov_215.085362_10_plen_110_part_00
MPRLGLRRPPPRARARGLLYGFAPRRARARAAAAAAASQPMAAHTCGRAALLPRCARREARRPSSSQQHAGQGPAGPIDLLKQKKKAVTCAPVNFTGRNWVTEVSGDAR